MRDTLGSVPIQEDDMDEKIKELRERARTAITEKATSLGELGDIRVKFLGKKGELTSLLRSMSALVAEERPRIGTEPWVSRIYAPFSIAKLSKNSLSYSHEKIYFL